MTKSALAKLTLLGLFSANACSLFVDADRSTVKDDLYQPSVFPQDDAGDAAAMEDAGEDAASAAGASGAGGAAGAAGSGGDSTAGGAAGVSGEGGGGG